MPNISILVQLPLWDSEQDPSHWLNASMKCLGEGTQHDLLALTKQM